MRGTKYLGRVSCGLLFATLLLTSRIGIPDNDMNAEPKPRFLVVSWVEDDAQIVKQGTFSQSSFRRLFLERYRLGGERYHPEAIGTVIGLLVARDKAKIISVPIWTWKSKDGASLFLCQATDDGSPPAFSVFSHSKKDLLDQIEKTIDEENRPRK